MIPVRVWIAVGVAIALSVGITLFSTHYMSLKNKAVVGEERGTILDSASKGIADGVEIDRVQEAYNQGLAQGRQGFHDAKEEAKRNEPETASRAVRTVPASVRNAASERRRARERLGCAGSECEERR